MPNLKKKPEDLLADFRFVENLIKFSDEKDIKQELREKSDISDEKELDEVSHEVFEIVNNLKKMDETDLLKIYGGAVGAEKQGLASEAIEVAILGGNIKKDLATGNVAGAFTKLIKDNVMQGARYLGSLFNYKIACNNYEMSVENAGEGVRSTDDLNKSRKNLSDMKHGLALAALTFVGSAAVMRMFRKKTKRK